MPEQLAEQLRNYLATEWKENPQGFLFLNSNGRPYAANRVVESGLWRVLDQLHIERAGLHAFRHSHASLLLHVGANPKVAQEQMRQSDARITLGTYGHVIGNAQRTAVEKIGEILCPNVPNWRFAVSIFNNLREAGRWFDSHRPLQKAR